MPTLYCEVCGHALANGAHPRVCSAACQAQVPTAAERFIKEWRAIEAEDSAATALSLAHPSLKPVCQRCDGMIGSDRKDGTAVCRCASSLSPQRKIE